jgi:hypothetical protein
MAAGVPALHAIIPRALRTALDHLASQRHLGLLLCLSLVAYMQVQTFVCKDASRFSPAPTCSGVSTDLATIMSDWPEMQKWCDEQCSNDLRPGCAAGGCTGGGCVKPSTNLLSQLARM